MVNNAFVIIMRYSNLKEILRSAIAKLNYFFFLSMSLPLNTLFCFLAFLHTGKTDRVSDFSVVCCMLTSEERKKKHFGFNGIIIADDGDHK